MDESFEACRIGPKIGQSVKASVVGESGHRWLKLEDSVLRMDLGPLAATRLFPICRSHRTSGCLVDQ